MGLGNVQASTQTVVSKPGLIAGNAGNWGNIAVGPGGQVVATWYDINSNAILVSVNPSGINAPSAFGPPAVAVNL